jgi:acetyltransferase-like isoleucine patch superfamily enzyme
MIFSSIKKLYFKCKTLKNTFKAKMKVSQYGYGLKVNYKSTFTNNTIIGNDCHFNGIDIVGNGKVIFGDHFHSGSNILIVTQNHNYYNSEFLPYDNIDILKKVIIGNCCWLGSRVIILPGTVIEEGVVVQAGSVLFGKIPKCAIVGGNPWKILKYRDIDKYDQLVQENKYI